MKTKISIILSLLFFSFTSCNNQDDTDEIICTTEYVYGLDVKLIDSTNGTIITTDVEVKIADGNYEETLMTLEGLDAFFGAGERPGNYIITVTSNNYQTYISESIVVTNDICHVITKSIEIQLTP